MAAKAIQNLENSVWYSGHDLKTRPIDIKKLSHNINARLVWFSDVYCGAKCPPPIKIPFDVFSHRFPVPLIVKRCIEEVEKRGLDIIGIYRLCGSETKKNMLRDAFEESPTIVDLSSENVPDINVITGKSLL
jgi:hypothetical protein